MIVLLHIVWINPPFKYAVENVEPKAFIGDTLVILCVINVEITDDEYLFLANCTDIEFNNWCVRKCK